jgi:hypothetical protein
MIVKSKPIEKIFPFKKEYWFVTDNGPAPKIETINSHESKVDQIIKKL